MKKIEQMTPEQAAQMIEFREQWRAVGLATGPADIEAVRPVINDFYARIGKDAPYIWRCESPLTAQLVINALWDNLEANLRNNLWDNLGDNLRANLWANLWDNLGANLRANLWDNLRDNLRANLRNNLGDNLEANLRNNLRANLRANLWANLGANLWANLWDNLRDNLRNNLRANLLDNLGDNLEANLWDNLRNNLWANLWNDLLDNLLNLEYHPSSLWGSLDSYWIAYYLFPHLYLREIHTDSQMALLNSWATIAHNAFWWYPFEGICFVCDRPSAIHMDEQWRMHNTSGPAVEFADGWKLYAVHGVTLDSEIIEHPETITAERIHNEENAERRRLMMEIYGHARYIQDSDAQLVSSDECGRLWRMPIEDDEPLVMVEVVNSTPEPDGSFRTYYLRVPPDIRTARQAVAWTFDMSEAEYHPTIES